MELSPKQQFVELVNKAANPLLITHQRPDGDALGSILALSLVLRKLGKQVTAICVDPVPAVFSFLPGSDKLSTEFKGTRDFIITLDAKEVQPDKIFYKVEDGKLNIVVTPKKGQYNEEMVAFRDGGFKYDLIIVLDSTDPERLGISFDANPDLFFETPVINIDHHAGNDFFGKVNVVDLTATSTSEILVSLIEALGQKFDEDTATALLCGITTDTGSFQNANTTPKALTIAAQLVAAGGRQQEIIKNIYKTRSLTTLKLWGVALSKMKLEPDYSFLWSSLSETDFTTVGAAEDESAGVVDELLKTASGVDFAMLLSERNGGVHGSLRNVSKGTDVAAIAAVFGGGGHAAAAAFQVVNTTLKASQEMIINKIKEFLGHVVVEKYNGKNQEVREQLKTVVPEAKPVVPPVVEAPKKVETNTEPSVKVIPNPNLSVPKELMPEPTPEKLAVPKPQDIAGLPKVEPLAENDPWKDVLSENLPTNDEVDSDISENQPKW